MSGNKLLRYIAVKGEFVLNVMELFIFTSQSFDK